MTAPDLIRAIDGVVSVFEALGIPYYVGGSVASSAYGFARATIDADLVADVRAAHVQPLVDALVADYYVDLDAARDAVKRRSMFNAIHLATMMKVDVYVLKGRPFDLESFRRKRSQPFVSGSREYSLGTPEDVLLHKLEWFRLGGEVSDRQWGDVVGVLRVQGDALDRAYLERWAGELGIEDLLARALDAAKG